jgi:DNA-binding IclR family transcriptional regulator
MSQSAARSHDLLASVIRAREPVGLMELAASTSLDKSTAARLLESLLQRGLVHRDVANKRYSVGPEFLSLAAISLRNSNLRTVVGHHLDELRDRTHETVTLHLKIGLDRVCIDGAESEQPLRRAVSLGETIPLHVGVTSKVIFAYLAQAEAEEVLAAAGDAASREKIEAGLRSARERGYYCAVGERIPGVGVLAAPIFDSSGVRAAIAIAGPSDRWDTDRMHEFAGDLRAATTQISDALASGTPRR